ncbi:hypothetical protein Zmor_012085 [Zophobas morio]|uniref:Arp2/3 complex 41 kDa subunit n=1 Tax=Zophobas morio TaxID=2755281 RepID=A0AA38HHK3_9CUCU|nr:hypothetical protein Zmor_012085 [Zophobas morio]
MASPTVINLSGSIPVSCFAWNGDRTQICVSFSTPEVYIYQKQGSSWDKIHSLLEHDQRVLSIDWEPQSNLLATCGEDRNAYVWKLESDGKWKPGLVVLRINRAATCVRWSPSGEKFAVGSGARIVSICYFQEEHNWWVAKNIKSGIRSTVTCLDWHPNSTLLAVGSSDFHVRLFSAAIKGVDKRPEDTSWAESSQLRTFGSLLHTWKSEVDGWVHDVAFSPAGEVLAWVSHSSCVCFVHSSDTSKILSVHEHSLPYRCCMFANENLLIAAGHSCAPNLYKCAGGEWKFEKSLDSGAKALSMLIYTVNQNFCRLYRVSLGWNSKLFAHDGLRKNI